MTGRKRDAAATRARLLQAAEDLFVERGFDGTRVDEIAAAAGANKRMIYVYFGSKEGIYAEVLRVNFERALDLLRPSPEPQPAAAETEAVIRRYFRFLLENPGFVRLLGWENLGRGRRAGRVLMEHAAAGLRGLAGILERGVAEGTFRADLDPGRTVLSISGLCLGWFTQAALREALGSPATATDADAYLAHVLRLVLDGVRAR